MQLDDLARQELAETSSGKAVHDQLRHQVQGGAQTARFDFPGNVEAVGPHPFGEGLFVVYTERKHGGPVVQRTSRWVEVAPDGEHRRAGVIDGMAESPNAAVACARDLDLVFATFVGESGQREVLALARASGAPKGVGCLEVAYRVTLPRRHLLVQDPEGRRVYVVGQHDGGLDVLPLGPEPPALPDRGAAPEVALPLNKLWDCTQGNILGLATRARAWFMRFKWRAVPELRALSAAIHAEHEGDLPALLELFWALSLSHDAAGAAALSADLAARFPDDPGVRETTWAALAVERRWAALADLLGPMDAAPLPEAHRKHRHHLLAAARLAQGDVDEAARHLEEGRALAGTCNLDPLGDLAGALSAPRPDEAAAVPVLRDLLAAVREADARLDHGDHEGVLPLFERAFFWEIRDAQSLARLATAHLALPARTPSARLRKSLALAFFADTLTENRVGFRTEVIVPGATWPDARLDAIGARARAWLARGEDDAATP